MAKKWEEADIQSYIDNFVEESLTLDYKAADALAMSDGKKKEVTKDVSAMANSAGGIIIYGLKEFQQSDKKHLAQLIAPVDRTKFSKEWLEQIINNIRPRIDGVLIESVSISTGVNDVAYVVDIPQSHTAHQAMDDRYYKRYNFMSVPMADHEIRDVMNRATTPDVTVEFTFRTKYQKSEKHLYFLEPIIKNLGKLVVNNFKLKFTFPQFVSLRRNPRANVTFSSDKTGNNITSFQSYAVLSPEDELNIGNDLQFEYEFTNATHDQMDNLFEAGKEPMVTWTLYADNMPPKYGEKPLRELQRF